MSEPRQLRVKANVVIVGTLIGVVVGAIVGYMIGNAVVGAVVFGLIAFLVTALSSPAELKMDPRTRGGWRGGF